MDKGFTLIEIIIAIGVLGFAVAMISLFALNVSQSELFISENLKIEEDIKQALRIMTPEIRSINSSSNGSYGIAAVSSSSFSFYSDIDADNYFEKVRYFLDGSTLKKGVIESSISPFIYDPGQEKIKEVINGISSDDIFYYYDDSYDGNQSPLDYPVDVSKIRSVKIVISVEKEINLMPVPVELSLFITIRNLRGI